MSVVRKKIKSLLGLLCFSLLLSSHNPARAEMDHSAHAKLGEVSQGFRGVFYGFLPCSDCNGIKTTLSLKQNNNYLIVTQQAKESSREFYEKGKYTWDDETKTVVLTPKKDAPTRKFHIENDSTIIQLNDDGSQVSGDKAEKYTLRRSDTVKSREVHIH
jgi:hypothetical protein